MEKGKMIQDPIHGYIIIQEQFINILNSPQFQRLKNIGQSSFRVLYPGATHDRFIHSIGTYHLAKKAIASFFCNILEDIEETEYLIGNQTLEYRKKLENTFLYASLLHDVGHVPFSHTCENQYKFNKYNFIDTRNVSNNLKDSIKRMYEELKESIKNTYEEKKNYNEVKMDIDTFIKEYDNLNENNPDKFKQPSPHEILSATMLIDDRETFWNENEKIGDIDFILAARMVIGLHHKIDKEYTKDTKIRKNIENCLISMLNSSSIDVDKLDYICRDTKMTGFSNVPLDIERITMALSAIKKEKEDNNEEFEYKLAFRKNMLSVIDNVFRAKIEQGLWLISHPTVVYENNLINRCIEELEHHVHGYKVNVFTYKSLGINGLTFNNKKYKLLSDCDIINDFKSIYSEKVPDAIAEYFDRAKRRKPIWKSYYEYRNLFEYNSEITNTTFRISSYFEKLIKYLEEKNKVLDSDTLKEIKEDNVEEDILKPAELLKKFCDDEKIEFDVVLLSVNNDFTKIDTNDVYILFDKNKANKYIDIPHCNYAKLEKFFYIYFKKNDKEDFKISFVDFIQEKCTSEIPQIRSGENNTVCT